MEQSENKYQCLKCGSVFTSNEKVKIKTNTGIPYFKSPCCLSNITSIDIKNQFLDKFLYVNTDDKYYKY